MVLSYTPQVGLAVDDIKGVQEKAALKKEALQVNIIYRTRIGRCNVSLLITDWVHSGCFESSAKGNCKMEKQAQLHSDVGERAF